MKFRFFINCQVTTRRSNHTSGQATRTVKQQQKIAKDVSQASRMTMCFRMPTMVAKTNSNLTNAMSNNISIKE